MSQQNSRFNKKKPEQRHKPLGESQKIALFAALICDADLWESFRDKATGSDFVAAEDKPFGLIWASLEALTEAEEPYDYSLVAAEADSRVEKDPDYVDSEGIDTVNKIFDKIVELGADSFAKTRGNYKRYMRQLLKELVQKQLTTQVNTTRSVLALPELLSRFETRLSAIDSAGSGNLDLPFPENEEDEDTALVKFTTGCDYLDQYMGGGHAAGEVYGFCAPYGVCKTLQACLLGVEAVKVTQKSWNDNGRRGVLPFVYLVFYEELGSSVRSRLLSSFSRITKDILELPAAERNFSSIKRGDYKDYERRIWGEHIGAGMVIPGEQERYDAAKLMMNRNLRVIHFNGSDARQNANAGAGVRGLVNVIREDQQQQGNPGVAMVCVDYAGAAADRYIEANELDTSELRHVIGKMPLRLKHHLAVPYKCPVWLFHQLSAAANSLAAGVAPKRTDTAEAKNFFEHCDFGFMVGMKTEDTSLAVISNVKQRRQEKRRDSVVKIDGLMCQMYSVANDYTLENNRIISTSELSRIASVKDDESYDEGLKRQEYSGDLPAYEDL